MGTTKHDNGRLAMSLWKPKEIIVHQRAACDGLTDRIVDRCPDVPVRFAESGRGKDVVRASSLLGTKKRSMLQTVLTGKNVLFITVPGQDTVDVFRQTDERIICPDFPRLKLSSNGCFYRCDWCYLKMTYRAAFPFITVRSRYEWIKKRLDKVLAEHKAPIMFNSGELGDSLSLEHLTGAAREFIPWFAEKPGAYLFMLTKSDRVEDIVDLEHNGHTVLTWSLNSQEISRRFELGAPGFSDRLSAAGKAARAGYRIRIRLDPIVPLEDWQKMYARTVREIARVIQPERITLGTLRFEENFMRMRRKLLVTGESLAGLMDGMVPMFEPKKVLGRKRPLKGKYSFPEKQRVELFSFLANEISKYLDSSLSLCKESERVWRSVGLEPRSDICVCQP